MADRDVELGTVLDTAPDEDDDAEDDPPDENELDPSGEPEVAPVPASSSAADEPLPDVVEVPDPELDDRPVLVVAVAAVAVPGICLDTTSPTTPVRAAADTATDVVARRTRLRAPSRRRRREAVCPWRPSRGERDIGGGEGAGGVITAGDHLNLAVTAQSGGSPL